MTTNELKAVAAIVAATAVGGTYAGTKITSTSLPITQEGFVLDSTESEITAINACVHGEPISMTRGIAESPILSEPKESLDDKGEVILDPEGKPLMIQERTGTNLVSTIAATLCDAEGKCNTKDLQPAEVACVDAILDKGPKGSKWALWELSDAQTPTGTKPVLDEEGKPVLDENGEPKTEPVFAKVTTGQIRFGEYAAVIDGLDKLQAGKEYKLMIPEREQ